ncbi:MAG: hypothetical protein QM610_13870 [Chitinophagaceae bacterium]
MENRMDTPTITVGWQHIINKIEQLNRLKNNPDAVADMVTVVNGLHSLLLRYSVEKNDTVNIANTRRVAVVMPSVFPDGKVTTVKNKEHEVMKEEVETMGTPTDFEDLSEVNEQDSSETTTVEAPVQESVAKIQETEKSTPEPTASEEGHDVSEDTDATSDNIDNTTEPKADGGLKESTPKPVVPEATTEIAEETQPTEEKKAAASPNKQFSIWEAYSSSEIPTLVQQDQYKSSENTEETIATTTTDVEQANAYGASPAPIKDLRKAISIGDRYMFISELFRGEESMYERSIKTINNFNVYQEACYWIDRELKVKLGWIDKSPVVKQFDALVKCRFA